MKDIIKSAGGNRMRSFDLDAKKFSTVKSDDMFAVKKKKPSPKSKETNNINKSVKSLKKMKGAEK